MCEAEKTEQAAKRRGSRRSLAFFLAKLMVAGGLLAWLLRSGRLDFSALGDAPHIGYLAPALVLLLIARLLPVWRWIGLLQVQQLEIGWLTALRMTWLGYFASLFLPGAVGGDLAKAYVACRHRPRDKTRAVSTVLLDRVLGLHTLLFLGGVAGMMLLLDRCSTPQAVVAWFPIILFGVLTVGLFLVFWRPTSSFALRFLPCRFRTALGDSLTLYRSEWRKMCGLWLVSVLCTISAIVTFYFVAVAFGMDVSVAQMMTVIPLVMLVNTLPISPGGLGVGEAAASELFGIFGLATGGALIILIVRLGGICLSVPGALAIVWPAKHGRAAPRGNIASLDSS